MEISVSRGVNSEGVAFFTCNTCGLSFPTADLQRLHMKTDWHRYNLKRRVASLPPISSEIFAEKILQQQAQEDQTEALNTGRKGRENGPRQVTKKDKKREDRLQRRQASNQAAEEASTIKRGENRPSSPASEISLSFSLGDPVSESGESNADNSSVRNSDIDSQVGSVSDIDHESETASKFDTETIGDDEVDRELKRRQERSKPIPPNHCFITGKEFATVEENVQNLWKTYSLFIPEKDFLTDLTGLMTYLGEKVGLGNMCLYCNFEGRSLESIRDHMIAKSHIKIPYESVEDKLEISEYYNFTSSYKHQRKAKSSVANGEDDEWEDEEENSDEEVVEGDAEGSDEEEYDQDAAYIDSTGVELVIGNMRVGHRSMARYYKQNFKPENTTPGQSTVAVASRVNGLLKTRNIEEDRAVKRVWREKKKIDNVTRRRETKFINNLKYYRDDMLQ